MHGADTNWETFCREKENIFIDIKFEEIHWRYLKLVWPRVHSSGCLFAWWQMRMTTSHGYHFLQAIFSSFVFLFSAYDDPGGGCTHQADSVLLQEANPCHRGLRGGQRRWQMEADLRWGVEPHEQQGDLWHVRLPCWEEIQRTRIQVSVICFFWRFQYCFPNISNLADRAVKSDTFSLSNNIP